MLKSIAPGSMFRGIFYPTFASYNSYSKIVNGGDGDYTQTETDGVTVIRFLEVQNNEKDTTETMNLVFNVTIDEGLDAGEYPVKVAAVAAKSTGNNTEAFINKEKIELKDGTITVVAEETHGAATDWSHDKTYHWHACTVDGCTDSAHIYDKAEHTYTLSATEVGTNIYTCACGYSYTTDALKDLFPLVVNYDLSAYSSSGVIKYTRAITKEIAININALGGKIVDFGTLFNSSGATLNISNADYVYARTDNAKGYSWDTMLSTGYNTTIGVQYSGMNFAQMNSNISYAGFVKYELNNETKYIYGATHTANLITYASEQTDDISKSLVEAATALNSASENLVATVSSAVQSYAIELTVKYDLSTTQLQFIPKYTRSGCKEIAQYIAELGGEITDFGAIFTTDSSKTLTVENANYKYSRLSSEKIYSWKTMQDTGYDTTLGIAYSGMNVSQMNSTLKFGTFVEYTDTNGDTQYFYPTDEFSYCFMDLIENDTSDLANILKGFRN